MSPKTSTSLTPLMRASSIGHFHTVQELLEDGADVNERGPRDSTALMFAAGGGHLDVVKLLVEHGADVTAREAGGWTARCHADADDDREVAAFLEEAERSMS